MLAYGPMERLLAALALCIAPAIALAQSTPSSQARAASEATADGWKAFSFVLEPKKMHEECQRVDAGQKRRYMWKADAPVDFNIHYHRGNDVFYPVMRDAMRGDGGTFAAKEGEDYCWMWTAKDKPAKVEGRVEVR